MSKEKILQKTIDILLLLTIFLFPLTMNIAYVSPQDPGHPLIALNLSISDFFLGIAFLLLLIKLFINRSLNGITFPAFPVLIFLLFAGLTLTYSSSVADWLKDFIQFIEYFLIFYTLLLGNLKTIRKGLVKELLIWQTTLVLIMAFLQYAIFDNSIYLVRGPFENRNLLGSYLSITLPLVLIELISTSSFYKKSWMAIILILSALVVLTGSAMITIVISFLVIGLILGKKMLLKISVVFILGGFLYFMVMPEKNKEALRDTISFYERGSISKNYYRRLTILSDLDKTVLFKKNIGKNYMYLTSNLFMSGKMPKIQNGNAYIEEEGKKHIKNFYMEMLASLNLISKNILLGVGIGNFQNNITIYYDGFQKINTSEPSVHCGYLIIGATTGILGLTAFIWMLFYFLKKSINIFMSSISEKNNRNYFALGCTGSLVSVIIQNFFTPILSAALLPLLIITLFNIGD